MPIILKKTNALHGDMDEIRVSTDELNIKSEEKKKAGIYIAFQVLCRRIGQTKALPDCISTG